jgi:hypothetical protein
MGILFRKSVYELTGNGLCPGMSKCRFVRVVLAPRSRMGRAIPLLPSGPFVAYYRVTFTFLSFVLFGEVVAVSV